MVRTVDWTEKIKGRIGEKAFALSCEKAGLQAIVLGTVQTAVDVLWNPNFDQGAVPLHAGTTVKTGKSRYRFHQGIHNAFVVLKEEGALVKNVADRLKRRVDWR